MRVDLQRDQFDVQHDPSLVAAEAMLASIRKLGYTPELVAANRGGEAPAVETVDVARLPAELRALFERAGRAQKVVLLRFTGPG